jgi:hypothetical protein
VNKLNRIVYLDTCDGSKKFQNAVLGKELILGVNCLMPDGKIRDFYGENFKETTGKELNNLLL